MLQEPWDTATELAAQTLEVLSVVATEGMGLKKPITVPRPKHVRSPAPARPTLPGVPPKDAAFKKGIATLMATSKGVHRVGSAA